MGVCGGLRLADHVQFKPKAVTLTPYLPPPLDSTAQTVQFSHLSQKMLKKDRSSATDLLCKIAHAIACLKLKGLSQDGVEGLPSTVR